MTYWVESMQSPEELREALRKSNAPFTDSRSDDEKALYSQQQADNRRMRADRSQFERYRVRLGDEAPKTFSQFRKLKKQDGEKWEDLQKLYRSKFPKTVDNSGESGIIESEGVTELEQAKKRDHKIYITDTAIEKVTNSNVPHYNDMQNQMIDNKHKELLKRAKMFNDSNETAVLFDLSSGEEAVMLGGENSVDIFENPNAVSMANSGRVLFLAHNHPSTQNFSYADIGVFLMNDSINGLSAVSNMGVAHIIAKSDKYDFAKAYEALSDIRRKYDIVDEETNKLIVKEFLKIAKFLGIEYC